MSLNSKLKVTFVTMGPLHLLKSAESLLSFVDLRVIQGWAPMNLPRWGIRLISLFVGHDITFAFKKRRPESLEGRNVSCGLAEFFLVAFLKCRVFPRHKVEHCAAILFGYQARKKILSTDIVHVRSGSGRGGLISLARKKGQKIVVDQSTPHANFTDKVLRKEYEKNDCPFPYGIESRFSQDILQDCLSADLLLVNSEFIRETFIQEGYPENKIRVVYLGVRRDFLSLKSNWTIRKKLQLLYTGSFAIRKGAEYILNAMSILRKHGCQFTLTIVGTVEYPQLAEEVPEDIHFVGHVPQERLKSYLSQADIYIFPSLCDGCASSCLEAMAAGLPVIATRESGVPIIHKKNGIIVDSKNARAIAEAVIQVGDDEQLRERLGKEASNLISEEYTWENYAQRVSNVYKELQ